jgi:UDP-N-acetylmuramoylalanine--D-glutamate ligase
LTTEILLFAERCRGDVVAVTGSNGKTTTTSLLGDIFARHNNATVVGGNLGKSLLGSVDQITPGTPVILELSSFQLEWLGPAGWYPQIGVITNLSPNHLDRHGTFEAYVRAKRQLIANQPPGTSMVLNARDPHLQSFANGTRARVVWFDGTGQKRTGSWLQDGRILLSLDSTVHDVMPASEIPLLGMHNCENVLAAVAAAGLAGIPAVTISQAIQEFQPVEHRLEFVAEIDGVRYFNDSIATTPESAICALRSFAAGTLILIAGGYDKKIPFDELGAEIAVRAGALITLGATADKIAQAARERGFPDASVFSAGNLQNAVAMAARIARVGQCVSLSPACASYDQFRNFEERGHSFKQLVHQLSS